MGKKSSSSSSGPSKFAKPYIAAGANALQSVYNQQQPALQNITESVQGTIPGLLQKFNQGDPTVDAAQGYSGDVLGGKFLGQGNPYLQQMIGQTAGDVTDRVNGAIGMRGRTGGDAHSSILARELADAENRLRYQDYSNERGYMENAAGRAPGLAQAEYAGLQPLLSAAQIGAEIPWTGVNNYAGGVAGLLGNYNTQSQKPSTASSIMQGVGTALSAASLFSDRRLKRDIEKLGEMEDGLGWYKFRYLWDDAPRQGVMADEVAELRPWALGPQVEGYATVNMGLL